MFILHIALQGCLRANNVPYGLTPDTGGHIKYLLELVAACDALEGVRRQQIIVRQFHDTGLGAIYGGAGEPVSQKSDIVRLAGATRDYVSKEEMYRELDALADNLEAHIRALPKKPDIIHAHYADAGWLAAEMKKRLGIAYVFTGHSLGRVKLRAVPGSDVRERVRLEDRAVRDAALIITSSIDESEYQYALYPDAAPERLRVNPPGCDVGQFIGPSVGNHCVEDSINASLDAPDKPCILALARPVWKKNLQGLLAAYASDPRLQDMANLVLFAGNWDDPTTLGAEARDILNGMQAVVEEHGLHGKVSMPKHHRVEDVPAIYDYARKRGGVFANVAFNEPFGLTFLEAAASGLPVVSTKHGGPNDIITRLQNGLLVDPKETDEIATALRTVISDRREWEAMSARGRENVGFYRWDRHARDYLADITAIVSPAPVPKRAYRHLLVCDIDNTLTGSRSGLAALKDWLARSPDTGFAVATGRSLNSAQAIVAEWTIPNPCAWITSVGSEIYWPDDASGRLLAGDDVWKAVAARCWERDRAEALLARLDWLEPQETREQRAFKLCYYLDDESRVPEVRTVLDAAGLEGELIYSHGRFLDFLPKGVSKGHAIAHVAQRLGVPLGRVAGAGDSGNDLHMLQMVGHPIVVANHTDELLPLRSQPNAFFATARHAEGVLEGMRRLMGASSTGLSGQNLPR